MKFLFSITAFLLFISCNKNEKENSSLLGMNLQTIEHHDFSFRDLKNNKASVILFLQPECPFCNSYGRILKQLDSTFTSQQVKIYAVVAGKNYPDSEIISYRDKFHLAFPFLLDPDFSLKQNLKATVTPQAFLLDSRGKILYHGMIDNWGYEIGKSRAHATEFYLTDAVNSFLAGKTSGMDSTKAVGCYIQ
ncbi:MAG: redoxin domain-containing protein [Chitinophagales bacterium]